MLFIISKYLSRGSKNTAAAAGDDRKRRKQRDREMPPASNGTTEEGGGHGCMAGCVPVRAKRAATVTTTTATIITTTSARTSRHNFVRSAASGLFPAAREFTNHESLPALPDAYSEFAAAFPQHGGLAGQADTIRDAEYGHLDRHVCLDYTGMNLFSHAQMNSSVPSTSAPAPAPAWQPPFFDIAYRSASLRSQCGGGGPAAAAGGVGAAVKRRIMASLKIPEDEYTMVCTANRTSAFRLLAESYSFAPGGGGGGRKKLLAVYDYESEAVGAMAESARRRGAEVMHASFAWPSMRVHAADLRKKLLRGRRRQSGRGLFVFPLVSRMTGARYPYLWMSAAAEQGWHVVLDACALGAKDLDTLGLSLLRPDFIVCNFFKVFGENPSGFAGLFVKKASLGALERSAVARSIGIVDIVPARRWSLRDDYSTDLDNSLTFPRLADLPPQTADDLDTSCSFSGPLSASATGRRTDAAENGDTPEICEVDSTASANEEDNDIPLPPAAAATEAEEEEEEEEESVLEVECRGLDHADALGLIAIGNRLRCISNWLVVAMQRLRHPHPEHGGGQQLVRLYGPRVKFERGPSLAFNVYDWKGEKVAPALVQKLADRHCISLACGFLHNIWFADKYEADRSAVLEQRSAGAGAGEVGIHVVSASLGFLSNFEDAYRLWAFVAKFLDADFVEKERWRYTALNQKTVEV